MEVSESEARGEGGARRRRLEGMRGGRRLVGVRGWVGWGKRRGIRRGAHLMIIKVSVISTFTLI